MSSIYTYIVMIVHAGNANEVFVLTLVNAVDIRLDVRATLSPLTFQCVNFNSSFTTAPFAISYKQVIKVFMRSTTSGWMSDLLIYFPDSRQCFGGNSHWDEWKASHCSMILGYFPQSWDEQATWEKCYSTSSEVASYFSSYSEYSSADTKLCIAIPSSNDTSYIFEGQIELEGLTTATSQIIIPSVPPFCHDETSDMSSSGHSSTLDSNFFYFILVFLILFCLGLMLVRMIVLRMMRKRNRPAQQSGVIVPRAFPVMEVASITLMTMELGEGREENEGRVVASMAAEEDSRLPPIAEVIENLSASSRQQHLSVQGYLVTDTTVA